MVLHVYIFTCLSIYIYIYVLYSDISIYTGNKYIYLQSICIYIFIYVYTVIATLPHLPGTMCRLQLAGCATAHLPAPEPFSLLQRRLWGSLHRTSTVEPNEVEEKKYNGGMMTCVEVEVVVVVVVVVVELLLFFNGWTLALMFFCSEVCVLYIS